jgi:DNA-binding beta-propeller fold protein YncE
MKTIWFGGIVFLSLAVPVAALAAAADYKVVERIKVPDGGFDYVTFDAATSRIYIARDEFTTVIDTKTGKSSQLNSASHGHMVVPIPGSTLGVLPQGRGSVLIADTAKDIAVATIPGGMGPDGAAYDPFSKLVFVMNHRGGDATLIDPVGQKAVATIPVGGTLEFPASDGAGKVFVNVEDQHQIAAIDVKLQKVVARYPMPECDSPTGLAYVPGSKLLISSCNGVAKFIQASDGKEVASLAIGKGPDAVIYDERRQLAFIPCSQEGILEVISVKDPAHIAIVQQVPTQAGTRTGALDPQSGRIYLIAAKRDPNATGGRGARLPGTYEVLVVAP